MAQLGQDYARNNLDFISQSADKAHICFKIESLGFENSRLWRAKFGCVTEQYSCKLARMVQKYQEPFYPSTDGSKHFFVHEMIM